MNKTSLLALKTVLVIVLKLFGALRSYLAPPLVVRRPHSDSASEELCSLPYAPGWDARNWSVFYKFICNA